MRYKSSMHGWYVLRFLSVKGSSEPTWSSTYRAVKYTADIIFRKLPIPLCTLPGCSHFSPVQENIAAAVDGNIFAPQYPTSAWWMRWVGSRDNLLRVKYWLPTLHFTGIGDWRLWHRRFLGRTTNLIDTYISTEIHPDFFQSPSKIPHTATVNCISLSARIYKKWSMGGELGRMEL